MADELGDCPKHGAVDVGALLFGDFAEEGEEDGARQAEELDDVDGPVPWEAC